jgi:hypothetical protein
MSFKYMNLLSSFIVIWHNIFKFYINIDLLINV